MKLPTSCRNFHFKCFQLFLIGELVLQNQNKTKAPKARKKKKKQKKAIVATVCHTLAGCTAKPFLEQDFPY